MHRTVVLISILVAFKASKTEDQKCRRDQARVVRKLVENELQPILDASDVVFGENCPLTAERDQYSEHERHKYQDSGGRWVCDYCGKMFYEEKWLDLHFDNRHATQIKQGAHITCLADYCDVFRCDVIQGYKTAKYWDVALCRDSDLKRTRTKCQNLISSCLPSGMLEADRNILKEKLKGALCSYLDCDNYWELPASEVSPIGTATYTIAGVILLFALMLYYLVVYAHFYTDEPVFDRKQTGEENLARPLYAPGDQDIRYRTTMLPS